MEVVVKTRHHAYRLFSGQVSEVWASLTNLPNPLFWLYKPFFCTRNPASKLIFLAIMFASFALFIKNCHTVNDDVAVFNLSDLSHYEKTSKSSNYLHTYTDWKAWWGNLRQLIVIGCNNNRIVYWPILSTIYCHKKTHKWCNHLLLCIKTSTY